VKQKGDLKMDNEILTQILTKLISIESDMKSTKVNMASMESNMKSIQIDVKSIKFRLDSVEANAFDINNQLLDINNQLFEIKAKQAEDSNLLRIIFENSIDLTERITGHDIKFEEMKA